MFVVIFCCIIGLVGKLSDVILISELLFKLFIIGKLNFLLSVINFFFGMELVKFLMW